MFETATTAPEPTRSSPSAPSQRAVALLIALAFPVTVSFGSEARAARLSDPTVTLVIAGARTQNGGAAVTTDLDELRRRIVDSDPTVRNIAALDLVRLETEDADGVIREVLGGPLNHGAEGSIVALLENIRVHGAVRFVPEVLDLSRRANGSAGKVRDTARATLLGMSGLPQAEAELIGAYRTSQDAGLRVQAVTILREYRSLEALAIFIETGPQTTGRLAVVLVAAIEAISGENHGSDWDAWNAWAEDALRRGEDGALDRGHALSRINDALRRRSEAVEDELVEAVRSYLSELAKASGEDNGSYRGELLRLLRDSRHAAIRGEAASRLGELPDARLVPEVADALLGALADHDPVVRTAAVTALGKVASKKAKSEDEAWGERLAKAHDAILERIESEFPLVQRAAVEAGGRIGDERSADVLVGLLQRLTGEWIEASLRGAVVGALGRKGAASAKAVAAVGRVLEKDPVLSNRYEAAIALGLMESTAAIDPLAAALHREGERQEVRWQAGDSLGRIGGDASVDALLRGLADPDDNIRKVSANNLGKIGSRKATSALVEMLDREASAVIRETVLQALGRIGDPAAGPSIETALQDPDPKVVKAAQSALRGVWGEDPTALVEGAEHVISLGNPAHVAFVLSVLQRASELIGEGDGAAPLRARESLARADAQRLAGQDQQAERGYDALLARRASLDRAVVTKALIGRALARQSDQPFETSEELRSLLADPEYGYEPSSPAYWRILATAAEILLHTGDTAQDPKRRAEAYAGARRMLDGVTPPASIDASLRERVQALVADAAAKAGQSEPTAALAPEENDRIVSIILELASEAKQGDPERFRARTEELEKIPRATRVEVLLGMIRHENLQFRQIGIERIRGLFPDATLEFDPEAAPEARAAAVDRIRSWWLDRRGRTEEPTPPSEEPAPADG